MHAEPTPDRVARQAQLVQRAGIIASHARGQQLAFPRAGGGLESLEPLDHAQEAVPPVLLRPRAQVLPGQQEANQRRGGHGLDEAA